MVFHYSVTKENYLKLLLSMLKKKESSPFRLLCFFALTVGQTAWVIYMLLTAELSRKGIIFMIIWSVVLSAINIVFRATRNKRAETALENLISTQQISADYWKAHTLTIADGSAKLRFGKTELNCPCAEIDLSEDADIVYLYSHGKIFDIVPAEYPEKSALVKAFSSARDGEAAAILDDTDGCDEVFRFSMTGRDFISAQVRAYQQYFVKNTLRAPRYLLKMGLCAALVWFMIISEPGIRTALCAALILFWNFPAILCITPITKKYLSSKLPALSWVGKDDTYDALVCRKGSCVVYSLGDMRWSVSPDTSSFICSDRRGITLLGSTWPAVFIPAEMFPNSFRLEEYVGVLRSVKTK